MIRYAPYMTGERGGEMIITGRFQGVILTILRQGLILTLMRGKLGK